MNRRVIDFMLLIGAIALAVAVYFYFQGNRQAEKNVVSGDTTPPATEQTGPKEKKAAPPVRPAETKQQEPSDHTVQPGPGNREKSAEPASPATGSRQGKVSDEPEQKVRKKPRPTPGEEHSVTEKKIITVPEEYPIEDAEKYYLPPEQRSPGNLGGPPPLKLPGMPMPSPPGEKRN